MHGQQNIKVFTGYSRFAGRNLKPRLLRPTTELWNFRTLTTKHSIANFTVVVPLEDADVEWTECLNCGTIVKYSRRENSTKKDHVRDFMVFSTNSFWRTKAIDER